MKNLHSLHKTQNVSSKINFFFSRGVTAYVHLNLKSIMPFRLIKMIRTRNVFALRHGDSASYINRTPTVRFQAIPLDNVLAVVKEIIHLGDYRFKEPWN